MAGKLNIGSRQTPMLSLPLIVGVGIALLIGCQSQALTRRGQPGAVAVVTLPEQQPVSDTPREILDTYCVVCHNEALNTAELTLDVANVEAPETSPEVWERVIRRLRTGTMPPAGIPRPDPRTYDVLASYLEAQIDAAWPANADPGRISAMHRLNRTEYGNSVRDLFGVDVNVAELLPGDQTADGSFDNYAASLSFTTAHVERYLSVARQVTRLAVGLPPVGPEGRVVEIPLHMEQEGVWDRSGTMRRLGPEGEPRLRMSFPRVGSTVSGFTFVGNIRST